MALWRLLFWIAAVAASPASAPSQSPVPAQAPSLELSLTESTRPTAGGSGDSSVTIITLKQHELTVHEHVERKSLTSKAPPDRDRHRALEVDELGKVRTLMGESQLMAHDNVDAGPPRGGCGGIEYRLELSVDIDGKRQRRQIRGPISEFCRKAPPDFASSQAWAGSRHLVEGLKALVGPP